MKVKPLFLAIFLFVFYPLAAQVRPNDVAEANRFWTNIVERSSEILERIEKEEKSEIDVSNFEKSAKEELKTNYYNGKVDDKVLQEAYEIVAKEIRKAAKQRFLEGFAESLGLRTMKILEIVPLGEFEKKKGLPSVVDYIQKRLQYDASEVLLVRVNSTATSESEMIEPAAKALSSLTGVDRFSLKWEMPNKRSKDGGVLRFSGEARFQERLMDLWAKEVFRGLFGGDKVILVHTQAWTKPVAEIGSILAHEAQHVYDIQENPDYFRVKLHNEDRQKLLSKVTGELRVQLFVEDLKNLKASKVYKQQVEGWLLRWKARSGLSAEELKKKKGLDPEALLEREYVSVVKDRYPYHYSFIERRGFSSQIGYLKASFPELSREQVVVVARKAAGVRSAMQNKLGEHVQQLSNGEKVVLQPGAYEMPFLIRFLEELYDEAE